ncbi:MAG: enoyl-CoA hydratase/isomerase family protein [Flavobacteriales bacterium]|nr:enoyl-CoA hydratase/isomerase family protein [Flavobacteriales bacterium]MCW8913616.1 enoyl-CoA hydratase/isomerase family protein [Flavobacteriales bacterium]MCW8937120.1 enoyl-CoA hydratase/isomerase family protein [Flavobacteriales bacterium]MCW8939299.1 enoyl-CoA hydratase/isomerase family protein [Flavobacteriales bacterium]MCW8969314.1 enoyl-CoA hydratase/isomerase family protein [Flavobacteriales bacterium]
MNATEQGNVTFEINEKGIATIEFFHPMSNSLPGKVLNQLANTITELGNNSQVKVIILKSEGDRAFCAGASFDELISIDDMETGKVFFSGFANVINAARKCPKFIIGRVQGKAVGGGVGMASAVDYCYATKFAAVKLSELAVGIGPFVVGPAVERKIGTSAMSMLAINATEWYPAEWAKEKSLYAEIFDSIEEMDEAIEVLANKLAQSNPEAMSMLKKVFWEGTEQWDTLLSERAAMSGKLVLSDFTRNAINAFKKK